MEHRTLAGAALTELADGNEWRQLKDASQLPLQVVEALGRLEDKMETYETLREDVDAVTIEVNRFTQSCHVLLEHIDDLLREHVGEALSSFHRCLESQ